MGAIVTHAIDHLIVDHCLIKNMTGGIHVRDEGLDSESSIYIGNNRIIDIWNNECGIQLAGVRNSPGIYIAWNEIIDVHSQWTDGINLFQSSGQPDAPIQIVNNYVEHVTPVDPGDVEFWGSGIVTDGLDIGGDTDFSNPADHTRYVNITDNQIVGCGATLGYGMDQKFYGNRIISAGRTRAGEKYLYQYASAVILGDYQPREWLQTLEMFDNVIGANNWRTETPLRVDRYLMFPESETHYYGNTSPHDGEITLEDEQAEFARWQQKLSENEQSVGP
jgi:hypothetical protein